MDAPRIDFYLIAGGGADGAACRLVEKAWRRRHRVYLRAVSADDAHRLDDLLWTWKGDSFVPHRVVEPGAPAPDDAPEDCVVLLGAGDALPDFVDDVLINLADDVPAGFERCARIAEIVADSDAARSAGRARYRHYRDHGCEQLFTHRV